MFGRPKFADADVMLGEIRIALSATAARLEAEHPDPSATDAQALAKWIFVAVAHSITMWGRWSREGILSVYSELGLVSSQRPRREMWAESVQEAELERMRVALVTHTSPASYEGISDAAAEYYEGLASIVPGPALSGEQFVRLAATAMSEIITRLQDLGYVKVR